MAVPVAYLFLVVFVGVEKIVFDLVLDPVDFKVYFTSMCLQGRSCVGNTKETYLFQYFDLRASNNAFVECFEIMNESDLAGLTYAFLISEATGSKVLCTVKNVVIKSAKK